ncbi:MAG: hypothetical protein OEX22_12850, partial [Cyclobacteriaceae bacterium]|nr:hypothetical protein [Cyclobacteriaceae bacterium]
MIFKIDKWTRIDNTLEQRNNILVSVFAIFGLFAATAQFSNDLYHKSFYSTKMDALIIFVLLSVYFLNERGRHKLAKIIFLGFINLILFVYACIVPKEVGVFLFFFPMISIATLIFNSNESKIRNPLIILPFIFIVILEFSDYHFFGNINIQQGDANSETSFIINLFISVIVLIFSLLYLVKINRNFETKKDEIAQELLEANEFLKKTNDELDHFVYSASHDLKAPLSSILGLINIAKLEVKEDK